MGTPGTNVEQRHLSMSVDELESEWDRVIDDGDIDTSVRKELTSLFHAALAQARGDTTDSSPGY